jgi:hypothetical protein
MSQKDLLENQVIEEILREKAGYYNARKKNLDFWLLISPNFLFLNNLDLKIKNTNFYKQKLTSLKLSGSNNKEMNFYAALISLDKEFIDWMKLRLGYFENIDQLLENNQNLNYVSDGIFGELKSIDKSNIILESNKNLLHPDIFNKKFTKSIEKYLSSNFY